MKWVLSVLFFACLSFSQAAVPACTSGCSDSHYCESSCYTDESNLRYTVTTDRFGSGQPKCTDGTAPCPDISSFDFANCQATCEADAECTAYIQDQDFNGQRCKFLTACQDMDEANVIYPCNDCISGRQCSSCPQFVYKSGSTMVHWVCEMQGDAYSRNPAEGTLCKPTASCASDKPELIKCTANQDDVNADGKWVDATTEVELTQEEVDDQECACQDLRIPAAADTNLFCENEHTVENGDYTIKSGDKCDLVCDAQVFIPIECRFNTDKTAASWHIEFDGDIDLGEDTTCLACSLNNCDDAPPTGSPFNVLV